MVIIGKVLVIKGKKVIMKKNGILGTGSVGQNYASKFISHGYDVMAGTETYMPLWLRIFGVTNNGAFNIKIVK